MFCGLQLCAVVGVRRIFLVCAARTEKGFFSSSRLAAENLLEQLVLGEPLLLRVAAAFCTSQQAIHHISAGAVYVEKESTQQEQLCRISLNSINNSHSCSTTRAAAVAVGAASAGISRLRGPVVHLQASNKEWSPVPPSCMCLLLGKVFWLPQLLQKRLQKPEEQKLRNKNKHLESLTMPMSLRIICFPPFASSPIHTLSRPFRNCL